MFMLRSSHWNWNKIVSIKVDHKANRHYHQINKDGLRYQDSKRRDHVMIERFSLHESDVGITEFVNKGGVSISGCLKSRFSDFQVNEIDISGNVAKLTSLTIPEPVRDEKNTPVDHDTLVDLITEQKFKELQVLLRAVSTTEVLINVAALDKIKRTIIHNTITSLFNRISTKTVVVNDKTFIRCKKTVKNEPPQTIKLWRHNYTYFLLYKENVDTFEATHQLAHNLNGLRGSAIKIAGLKDKRAKTTQWACIRGVDPTNIAEAAKHLPNIHVGNFKFKEESMKIGDLQGNRFRIAIRDINEKESVICDRLDSLKTNGFINYFGVQRFGIHTSPRSNEVGLAIIQGKFQEACELILKPRKYDVPEIMLVRECWWNTRNAKLALQQLHSKRYKNHDVVHLLLGFISNDGSDNYSSILSAIPLNVRVMYINAYRSLVWNEMASKRLKNFGLDLLIGDLVYIDSVAMNEHEKVDISDEFKSREHEDDVPVKNEEKFSRLALIVKELTEEDIKSGKYSIYDVVLPVPGRFVKYPLNECGVWYKERLAKDEVNFESIQNAWAYITCGSYRNLIARPTSLNSCFLNYKNKFDTLILSDWDELENKPKPANAGPLKALVLDFCLKKSGYATIVIREILKMNITNQKSTDW